METAVQARQKRGLYGVVAMILLTIAIFLVPQFIAVLIVGTYPAIQGWGEERSIAWLSESTFAQFFIMSLVAALTIATVLYLLKRRAVPYADIGIKKPRWRDIIYAILAYGAYFVTYFLVIIVATQLLPSLNVEQEQDIGFDQVVGQVQILMAFVSLVILPPFWEEVVFRGFLFTGLRARLHLLLAMVVTSVLFAAVHLQIGNGQPLLWVAAIDTFVLSMYLCYLRDKTGSLVAPILLHAGKNFVAFYFLFLR
jgi:hypothetical protein